MSPLKQVTIQTRRGLVAACLLALFMLPAAGWVAGSRLARTSAQSDRTAELARQIQEQRQRGAAQINKATKRLCHQQKRAFDNLKMLQRRAIRQTRALQVPGFGPVQKRQSIALSREAIRALSIDCRTLPQVPRPPK